MSRRVLAILPVALAGLPASAQAQSSSPPPSAADRAQAADALDCKRRQEAASISGEIVVCGNREINDRNRITSRSEAAARYAARTRDASDPRAPDFAPPPCTPNLLTWCPSAGSGEAAPVIVDFAALPPPPEGSDADRIRKGEVPE